VIPEFPAPDSWKLPIGAGRRFISNWMTTIRSPSASVLFSRDTYNAVTETVSDRGSDGLVPLNFDVGVWAFQEAGGGTARMEAQETLKQLFIGNQADLDLAAATNGIHVLSFSGGRHITDTINGQPVWRAMDMTLIVRVCGRRTYAATEAITGNRPGA
jgi:hypothetical protein